ncbi:MAG TPA: FGGY family carbohydrate kinase [Anaerolineae bacterium]|nr:FGGY family carbohydrate kinase [Anaerolineae bacterium]
MSEQFVLGIDQGTSGSKAVILNELGEVVGYGNRPLERQYPQPGWVEQDPRVVAKGVAEAVTAALGAAKIEPRQIVACGLTSQRNTVFAWDRVSGEPIGSAITWQDLRVSSLLETVRTPLLAEARYRLGYPPGPYMGALHLAWRRRYEAAFDEAAKNGRLRLGLSTAWLLQALGQPNGHQMDSSLVQAMGVYDFRTGSYWQAWLDFWGIPLEALPHVTPTVTTFGEMMITAPDGKRAAVPVTAMIGDQQAAMFGHGARQPGMAACTHGTASYVKVCMGTQIPEQDKINTYHAWHLGEKPTFCLEAPTTVTGAAARWLQDNLGLFSDYEMMTQLAGEVDGSDGVYFVPAFTGMEMPEAAPQARGTLLGLTLGHGRGHIVRAFFEAIGYQMRAILELIAEESGVQASSLSVGGGVSASDLACQIQANLVGVPILRPAFRDTTAWAAAVLSGLEGGVWNELADLPHLPGGETRFEPEFNGDKWLLGYERWQEAVALARQW